MIFKKYLLLLIAIFFSAKNFSQTPGMIFDPATGGGAAVLDPNGDGYTSNTTAGFITDDQAESELPYVAFNFLAVEPTSDLGPGPDCGFTDFVDEGDEDPAQYYFDASNNWLFRLRMGKALTNSKSYSILIDTDEKFGSSGANADPNAVSGNPGFEIEIVLATNFGVYVYNVDGKNSTISPVLMRTYAVHTNYQKSIALTTNCGDPDYFYDFFVPFGDLTTDFGITTSTPLRMAIIDNMAAGASSIGQPSSMSDLGGVDDASCGGNYETCFGDVLDIYPPTCVTCPPQPDRSECPGINSPIANGATSVSGTSSHADGTTIKVFKNGTQIGTATVSGGTWTLSGISPSLASNDLIEASATASGKSESVKNCDQTIVAQICTAAITSATSCNANKAFQGLGVAGAVINLYQGGNPTPLTPTSGYNFTSTPNTITAGSLPSTLSPSTDNWLWRCVGSGQTSSCTAGGGPCITDGQYRLTQQAPGQCESDPFYICIGSAGTSTAPIITTNPILITTTSVSGTCVSVASPGNQIVLYADGVQIAATTVISSTSWTISSLTLTFGQVLTAKAIEDTKCISAASASVTVSRVSAPPVVTGVYCATAPITSVSGTSSEPGGTVIQVYENGVAEGATTIVASNGTWTANSGISIAIGSVITAKATVTGGEQSVASNSVTVGNKTTNAVTITSSPITEGDASVSGTGTNGDVITLYIDGFPVGGTTTVAGGTWTISGLGTYDLYTDGIVTATAASAGMCESNPSNSVTVICIQPLTNLTVDPVDTTVCTGSVVANVRVLASQAGVIYQLFNGATATGSSKLGTGGTITLNSGTLSASTTLTVKAIKIPVGSCSATLTDNVPVTVNAVPTLTLTTGVSTNPICENNSTNITVANSQVGFSYQLRNDAGDINVGSAVAGTGGAINLPTGNISTTTTYNVYATGVSPSNCSGELTTVQTVTVNPGPVLTLAVGASSNPICSGTSTNITVANSQVGFSYQLRNDADDSNVGSSVAGTGGTINLPTGNLTSTTTFNVFANGAGCTGELNTTITITVNPLPTPSFTSAPTPVCVNSTGNIYATQSGMTSYAWTISGGTITSGGTASDNTATVTWTTAGTQSITVTYTDGNGCAAAAPILQTVTVNSLPTPSFTAAPNPVCENSTGNIYTTQAGMISYTWTISGGTITSGGTVNDNSATVTWTTVGTQSISVNYTDANGCTASSATTQTVTVTALPSAPTGTSPQTFCDAGTVGDLTATGSNIQWYSVSSGGSPLAVATALVNGNSYYASQTVSGCESSSRLQVVVNINSSSTSTITATACDTYTLNATTYTTTGTYTQTIPNAVGCDSTITLNLTIKNSSSSTITTTACDTYTLNATTYTATGTYTQTIPNAVGCDSTITLNLTIKNRSRSAITTTACDTYTLNATTYTVSGTYTQTISNAVGCDSVITLNLTIKNSSSSTVSATACDTYTLNATTYTATGTYSQTIPNAVGCDSMITLNLTIVPSQTANAGTDQNLTCGTTTVTLSATAPTSGAGAWTVIAGTGTITSPSNANSGVTGLSSGVNTFRWTITNAPCGNVFDDVDINVVCGNLPPNAQNDLITIPEDSMASIGVLANDNEPNGDSLILSIVTPPSNGIAILNGDSIDYIPNPNFFGSDTIVYAICDTVTPPLCDTALVIITVTPVNDGPVVNDTIVVTVEDSTITVCLPISDVDPGSTFSATLCGIANGTASITVTGNQVCVAYTPNLNFNGLDSVCVVVCDNGTPSLCDTAHIYITVTPVNDPPVVPDTSVTTPEDTPITVCIPITDVDTGSAFAGNLCGVTNGTATVSISGNQVCATYNPTNGFNGTGTVCVVVCDNGIPSLCDTATIAITVTPVNDKPIALNDSLTINEDAGINSINVQANDSDPDGNPLTTSIVSGPSNGIALVNGNNIDYTPNANFNGNDTVIYKVCDNGTPVLCDTAIVIIKVNPVNDAPDAVTDFVSTNEETPVVIDVQANDSDIDGDPLITSVIVTSSNGSVTILNNDSLSYVPNQNFYGMDTIIYQICDNGIPPLCDADTVFINVININDAPVALDDYSTTNPLVPDTVNVLLNDLDPDSDPLTVTIVSQPDSGSATLFGNQIIYVTNGTFINGVDTIIYSVCDNGSPQLCDTAMVIIYVPETSLPPIARDDYVTVPEDQTVVINVLANDADPNIPGDTLFVTLFSGPANGTAFVTAGNQISYTPNLNYNGADSLVYVICDTTPFCDFAVVHIIVTPVNDAPNAVADSAITNVNISVTVDVQANDSDVDGNTLITSVIVPPMNGTVTVLNNDSVIYTPNTNYTGTDYFVYQICDNGVPTLCDADTVFINVFPNNNPPVAMTDAVSVNEDSSINIDVQNNDSDPDGNSLTTSILSGPGNGTATVLNGDSISYTPNPNYNGADTIVYQICDNGTPQLCDADTVFINVIPVNDGPTVNDTSVVTAEDSTITVCLPISDVDAGSTFTASLCGVANGTASVTVTGNQICVTYTPNLNFNGLDSVCLVVCDNGTPALCDTAHIYITVTPLNDPPAVNDTSIVTSEDNPTIVCIPIADPDTGQIFTVSNCGNPVNGTYTATLTGNQVCITYTPNLNFNGQDSLCIVVCDNGTPSLCDTSHIYITVTPANDPPVVNDTAITTTAGNPATVCIPIMDVDTGQTYSVSNCGNPANGTYTATVTGNQVCVTYTPNATFIGPDSLCIVVCDNGMPALCDTAHVYINVISVNDPPVVTDTSTYVPEDSIITICTPIADIDSGSVFSASLCGVTNGTASVTVTGNQLCVTFVPTPNYNGPANICVVVCDNGIPTLCDTGNISITVIPRNDPPVVNDSSAAIANDSSLLICIPIVDIDTGQTFSATLCGVSNGNAVAGASGNLLCISYTPNSGFVGTDTVCVIVCDDGAPPLCDTAWVVITVTGDTTSPPPPPPPPADLSFIIPGGFSPNGDNVNDLFVIIGIERYPDNHIIIFNRWGNQVYEAQPYENKWDGTYQGNLSVGNILPAGTYYYVLDLGNGSEIIKRYVYLSR